MMAHPEFQKRAQDQLDNVVGRSRTPTFADAPNLPYIQALVKESLRWRPVVRWASPCHNSGRLVEGMSSEGDALHRNLWHVITIRLPTVMMLRASIQRVLDEQESLFLSCGNARRCHCTYASEAACVGQPLRMTRCSSVCHGGSGPARLEPSQDENGEEVPLDTETPYDTEWSCKLESSSPLFMLHHALTNGF